MWTKCTFHPFQKYINNEMKKEQRNNRSILVEYEHQAKHLKFTLYFDNGMLRQYHINIIQNAKIMNILNAIHGIYAQI